MTEQTMIRRMAFLAVFQLDARGELTDEELATAVLHGDEPLLENARPERKQQTAAWKLAREAFADRKRCDDVMKNLAPEWPAYRQAAVDRALLRLAHFEIHSGRVPAPVAIDSAVELAKEFSTEKSPGFINALLDQAAKRLAEKRENKETDDDNAQVAPDTEPKAKTEPKPRPEPEIKRRKKPVESDSDGAGD